MSVGEKGLVGLGNGVCVCGGDAVCGGEDERGEGEEERRGRGDDDVGKGECDG